MLRVLLVDDERLARLELTRLLQKLDDIEIIGEAANADEAKEKIEALNPDLIFLDINMPEKNGFDLLQQLEYTPHVIFVTAYDQYAIQAFEVNALDYVLKPVKPERLIQSIEKVRASLAVENKTDNALELLDINKQIFIKDGNKCYFIKLGDVHLFESVGNYAQLHVDTNRPLIHKSLNQLEERLPEQVFFRANRQQIINLNFIQNIESFFKGGLQVTLKSGDKIEVSTRQAVKFKELMSL